MEDVIIGLEIHVQLNRLQIQDVLRLLYSLS